MAAPWHDEKATCGRFGVERLPLTCAQRGRLHASRNAPLSRLSVDQWTASPYGWRPAHRRWFPVSFGGGIPAIAGLLWDGQLLRRTTDMKIRYDTTSHRPARTFRPTRAAPRMDSILARRTRIAPIHQSYPPRFTLVRWIKPGQRRTPAASTNSPAGGAGPHHDERHRLDDGVFSVSVVGNRGHSGA